MSEAGEEKIDCGLAVTGFHCNPCDLQTASSRHKQYESPILVFTLRQRKTTASLATYSLTQGTDDEGGRRVGKGERERSEK